MFEGSFHLIFPVFFFNLFHGQQGMRKREKIPNTVGKSKALELERPCLPFSSCVPKSSFLNLSKLLRSSVDWGW
jgi:hypothetical protein